MLCRLLALPQELGKTDKKQTPIQFSHGLLIKRLTENVVAEGVSVQSHLVLIDRKAIPGVLDFCSTLVTPEHSAQRSHHKLTALLKQKTNSSPIYPPKLRITKSEGNRASGQ